MMLKKNERPPNELHNDSKTKMQHKDA